MAREERIQITPKVERPFFHPEKKVYESFPPVNTEGEPFEAERPDYLDTCQHRWKIEPPSGETSPGKCDHCGEVRSFKNSIVKYRWEDDMSRGPVETAMATWSNGSEEGDDY